MTRVLIDTSVYVSALIGRKGSAPDVVIRAFIDDRLDVIVSPLVIQELADVLTRPKFRAYVDQKRAGEYVERIKRHATHADDPPNVPATVRDAKDDYLVALGRHASVDAIISLDRDLLDAALDHPPVWTPRRLVEALDEQPD